MRMAAATIGSTSLVCLPVPTPTAPVSSQAGGSLPQPNTGSAETTPLHETPRLLATEITAALASRTTKPRLLMAAAVGFALGRVFGPTKSKPNRL